MRKLTNEQKWGAHDALLSSAIYGFGFIATKYVLEAWSPLTTTFARLFIAMLGGLILLAVTRKTSDLRGHWKASFIPGLVFAAELLAIAYGLVTTSVSNSVFIANTYVVLVPFFIAFNPFSMEGVRHLFFVSFALLGVAMVSDFNTVSISDSGDFLCLLSSFLTAVQIITVQRASRYISSPVAFNICQCAWGSLFLGAGMLLFETGNPFAGATPIVWAGILCAGLLCTLLATTLQVRAQMRIGATAASLLFLMDAPFAAIFGMVLLSETFSAFQLVGAFVILLTSLGQFYFDWKVTKTTAEIVPVPAAVAIEKLDEIA